MGICKPTAKAGETRVLFSQTLPYIFIRAEKSGELMPSDLLLLQFYPDDVYVYGANDHTRKTFHLILDDFF